MSKDESLSQTTSISTFQVPQVLPQTPSPPGLAHVSSFNITVPSPFVNSPPHPTLIRPTASMSSIPAIHPRPYTAYPSASPMVARPPGLLIKPQTMGRFPRPIPLVPRALSGLFPMSAQGMRVPYTPLPEPQLPRVTPVGHPGVTPVRPLGGSFVNSTASGNQSAVSSVTDAELPPRTGSDKPVSDVSINVGPPAVEQLDAWTACKTERGPVFYYNAVTGKSTCEKPVGFEGELSMPVQECYLCLVRGLPTSVTTEQVREIFSKFGRILDAMVFMNNFTDVSMGHAYIIFETRTARSAAMSCNGMFWGGDMISVCDAEKGFGVNAYEVEMDNLVIALPSVNLVKDGRWSGLIVAAVDLEKATQMLLITKDHPRVFVMIVLDQLDTIMWHVRAR